MANKQQKILILNIGGTFNKYYDQIDGQLKVSSDNKFINDILIKAKISHIQVDGLIYKDSLDMTLEDRKQIVKYIKNANYDKIIIVHGTDTISKTAKYISKHIKNKMIILTGSMMPYSIDFTEATANLMLSIGYISNRTKNDVFIAMHGFVKKFYNIKKNRSKGIFECQK
jgi:L-asparaginase